jgi:hypothetical protein
MSKSFRKPGLHSDCNLLQKILLIRKEILSIPANVSEYKHAKHQQNLEKPPDWASANCRNGTAYTSKGTSCFCPGRS